jgi:hypothetical protein
MVALTLFYGEFIMMLDIQSEFTTRIAYPPVAAVTDNTVQTSTTLDLSGQVGAVLEFVTGTLSDTDATFALVLFEGDASDMSDETAVADADLVNLESTAAFTFADDGEARRIGYRGVKRYIRAKITPTGNTGNLFLAGHWRTKPIHQPGTAI